MNKLVNICVGQPKEVMFNEKPIQTSIFKYPVEGSAKACLHNIEGDRQADLTVHGGRDKAIYVYSEDNYDRWSEILGRPQLESAQFGENLTVQGCLDTQILIGETLQIGSVIVKVTQPRIPCFKLGMRFNDKMMPKLFWETGLLGFYLRVEKEGTFKRGDVFNSLERPSHGITVRDLWSVVTDGNQDGAKRALAALDHIDDGWILRLNKLAKQELQI